MTKLVVFDVDGTILDSITMFERVVRAYSQDKGLPMPCMDTIRLGYADPMNHDFKWGVSREEQYRHLMGTYELGDSWSMSEHPERTPRFFDGVEETLVHLKDLGHTLAIVTSKSETPLLHILEYHNMGKYFSSYRTSDDVKRRGEAEKPAPDQLLSVMRELKFAPEETVMVGDTSMDVKMGRSANAYALGVAWGAHRVEHLFDAGAHHVIDTHFGDFVPTVRKIFG